MARHLVPGISEYETEAEGPGYDTRGEDVRGMGMSYEKNEREMTGIQRQGIISCCSPLAGKPVM